MHGANYCVYIGQDGTKGSTNEAGVHKGMRKSLPATVREQEHRLKEQHGMSQRLKDRLKGLALRTYATGDLSSSMPSTHPPPGAYIREILPCLLLRNQREKTRV